MSKTVAELNDMLLGKIDEIELLRKAVVQGAELAQLVESMIDQEDLNDSAGWGCIQSHAGKMIDTATAIINPKRSDHE